ncbi:MAG: hypothetical protein ACYCUT_05525 [bacterium]
MGKLTEYFDKNIDRFLPNKRQNSDKTKKQHRQIIRHYLEYAETLGLNHTGQLKESVLGRYIKTKKWKSPETNANIKSGSLNLIKN